MNPLYVLEVALAFFFMILIHEFGHFVVGRLCGVEVKEFAIGFFTKLYSRKWGKTEYSIRALPLGGFCSFKGGDISGESPEKMYEKPPEPGDFLYAAWWKRILISVAGPGMNFLSALLIVTMLFLVKGEIIPVEKPLLGFVPPGSLAEKAGLRKGDLLLTVNGKEITNLLTAYDDLFPDYGKSAFVTLQRKGTTIQAIIERPPKPMNEWATIGPFHRFLAAFGFGPSPKEPDLGILGAKKTVLGQVLLGNPARNAGLLDGDEITAINGQKVSDWSQLAYLIRNIQTDPLQVEFLRDHKTHIVSIHRIFTGDYMAIGIQPAPFPLDQEAVKKVSPYQALVDSSVFTVGKCKQLAGGIWMLVTGKISLRNSVAGPVTIMRLMYHQASNWDDFFTMVAVISLVLFLMNLLPIPVVDGGQIVLFFIEGIKRSPVSVKLQIIYQQVGLALVGGLMILAFFNDFKNIFLEFHNHIH